MKKIPKFKTEAEDVSGRDKLSQKWSFRIEPLWGWSC
jgi:hypothetical protein